MNQDEVIIDVRDPDKYNSDHIAGAVNFSHTQIDAGQVPDLPKDAPIVLYCGTGNKAGRMKAQLEQEGFTNLRSTSLPRLKHVTKASNTSKKTCILSASTI
jgi:rhodanese-related sulfurtransferase